MRCRYCGKEIDKEYCDFKCRKAFLDFWDNEDKYRGRRKPLIIGAFVISIPLIILFGGGGATALFFMLGLIVMTHPYPSSKLKKNVPVRGAVLRVRINGLILMLIGLPFLFLIYTPFF